MSSYQNLAVLSRSEPLLLTSHFSDQEWNRVAHAEYPSRRTPRNLAIAPGPSKRKRKHDSSSDSSLLEVPIRPQSHQWKQDDPRSISPRRPENQPTTPRKKQKVASSDSGLSSHPATPSPPKETFEKRARHKTREDRYEPRKKEKRQGKIAVEKSSRKKREKRGDRKKAARKAGEELMQNFSSKSIAQDRLTVGALSIKIRNRLTAVDTPIPRSWVVQQWPGFIPCKTSRK